MAPPPDLTARSNRARKALNYLVGEVLKRTGGKADPVQVRRLMIKRLQQ